MQREADLYERLGRYLDRRYPRVLYHFDPPGLSQQVPNLYGRSQQRAWPRLFIPTPKYAETEMGRVPYGGLFLMPKPEGTRLRATNGRWTNRSIEAEAAVLAELQEQGYIALFAVGYEASIELIDSYMLGTPVVSQAVQQLTLDT